jgi:uncharacterized protein YjbI with pentapeptide repeats
MSLGMKPREKYEDLFFHNEDFPILDLNVHLVKCHFYASRFKKTSFKGSILEDCTFDYTIFSRCNFDGAVLKDSDVSVYTKQVYFRGCSFKGATISLLVDGDAVFDNCNLEGATFKDCDFACASFQGSNCKGVDFTGITYNYQEAQDQHFNGYNHDPRLLFQGADLSGAKFDGFSLNHAQFEGAILDGASFRGCDLSSELVDLTGWGCCDFYSEGTSFKGCDMSKADFTDADLTGVLK